MCQELQSLIKAGANQNLLFRLNSNDPNDQAWLVDLVTRQNLGTGILRKIGTTRIQLMGISSLPTFFSRNAGGKSPVDHLNAAGHAPFCDIGWSRSGSQIPRELERTNVVVRPATFQIWEVTQDATMSRATTYLGTSDNTFATLPQIAAIIDQETKEKRLTLNVGGRVNWFLVKTLRGVNCYGFSWTKEGWKLDNYWLYDIAEDPMNPISKGDQVYTLAL